MRPSHFSALSESVRAAESLAQYSYSTATTAYTHSVDTAIENALFEFNNASIGADQLRDSQTVTARSSAMQGLVSAEGNSLKSQSAASKDWSRGIATAYGNGAKNGALFAVTKNSASTTKVLKGLTQTLATGGSTGTSLLLLLNPNDPANQGVGSGGVGSGEEDDQTTPPSTDPAGDLVTATNAADDTFDQANATAETARVTAVTGVRDGLDSGLAAADGTWGGTMDTAGAALGSALDGIQDFDWQHVRDYVGAVTGARRAAELGALTAQVGFVGSYYNSLNSYTGSIATASVTHAGAYAQSTADYYVNTADHEADTAEAAGAANAAALRAKADAFAAFAGTYVSYLTSEAQSAATTAMTNVATANTTALTTITTEVATATTDINTFYTGQVATAQNPPPVDPDANGDGILDPPLATATQSITASIDAAKTAKTTDRTTVHTAFNEPTTRRTTSSTTTYTFQTTNTPAGSGGSTGTSGGIILYQTPGGPTGTTTNPPPTIPLTPSNGPMTPEESEFWLRREAQDPFRDAEIVPDSVAADAAARRINDLMNEGLQNLAKIPKEAFDEFRKAGGAWRGGELPDGTTQYVHQSSQGWHAFVYRRQYEYVWHPDPLLDNGGSWNKVEVPGYYEHHHIGASGITSFAAFQEELIRQQKSQSAFYANSLEFAFHMIPFATAADALVNGEGVDTTEDKVYVLVTTVGDVAWLVGKAGTIMVKVAKGASDLQKGTKYVLYGTRLSMAANASAAAFDVILLATDENNKGAHAGDLLLRLALLGLDAKQQKALQASLKDLAESQAARQAVDTTAQKTLDDVEEALGSRSAGAASTSDDFNFTSNRQYELNPKHGITPRIQGGVYIGKRPTNPVDGLADSIPVGGTSRTRRIVYDPETGEICVYNRDRDWWDRTEEGSAIQIGGIWHGHVQPWEELTQDLRKTLIDAGLFTSKGKYIGN